MFGFGGKKEDYVSKFDALNPRCAPYFHELVKQVLANLGQPGSSERFFDDKGMRRQLESDCANARAARGKVAPDDAVENTIMPIFFALTDLEKRDRGNVPPAIVGLSGAIPFIRRIVFGFAPGLSDGSAEATGEKTIEMLFKLHFMMRDASAASCLSGSREFVEMLMQGCAEGTRG